jgi:tripartite ATP-independent transporter DctP family solute receptor
MIRTTRRTWLATAGATLAMPAIARAQPATFAWRLGHTAPDSFPLHRRLLEAAAEVAERSDGRLRIEILGNGQLGSAMGQLTQLRGGTLEMMPVAGQILQGVQALTALPLTGFAWTDHAPLWRALDGELGRTLRALLRQRSGLVPLDTIWDFGFRVVTTTDRPVRTAADLAGLRLRTPVEPEYVALFQALKAAPIAMPLSETVRALDQRQVDGQEGLLALAMALGLQNVQRFCARTNHVWDGLWLCVGANAWRSLPDPLQATLATAFNAAGQRQRADHAEQDTSILAALARDGMTVTSPDPASFRAMLREAGYYRDLKRKFGDRLWELQEQFTGRLA